MRITVTADDFGRSFEAVETIAHGLATGLIRNATLAPGQSHFEGAAAFARSNPAHGYGVRIRIAGVGAGRPAAPASSLADRPGWLWPGPVLRLRSALGRISPADIQREAAVQIADVVRAGVRPDYAVVDPGLWSLPAVAAGLRAALVEAGIAAVRSSRRIDAAGRPLVPDRRSSPAGLASTDAVFVPGAVPTVLGEAADALASLEVVLRPAPRAAADAALWTRAEAVAALAKRRGFAVLSWRDMALLPQATSDPSPQRPAASPLAAPTARNG